MKASSALGAHFVMVDHAQLFFNFYNNFIIIIIINFFIIIIIIIIIIEFGLGYYVLQIIIEMS